MEIQQRKRVPKIIYNNELLKNTMLSNSVNTYTTPNNMNGSTLINFICKCNVPTNKAFNYIVKYGAFCEQCGKQASKEKRKQTTIKKWGVDCVLQSGTIKQKIKSTNLKKYGVEYTQQNKNIKDKSKAACIEKYGVDNPNKCQDIINKAKTTNMRKYGVSNPNKLDKIKEKTKATNIEKYGIACILQHDTVRNKVMNSCLEKYNSVNGFSNNESIKKAKETRIKLYGCDNMFQSTYFQEKRKDTMIAKYGVEHALQSAELLEKQLSSSYSFKLYKLPSGKTVKIQGFEHYALDELLTIYSEDQITVERKNVPRITYQYMNKQHYYFPDFYIPHENKIIEVKSEWTLNYKIEITEIKAKACFDKGYTFELWAYDQRGTKLNNINVDIDNGRRLLPPAAIVDTSSQ